VPGLRPWFAFEEATLRSLASLTHSVRLRTRTARWTGLGAHGWVCNLHPSTETCLLADLHRNPGSLADNRVSSNDSGEPNGVSHEQNGDVVAAAPATTDRFVQCTICAAIEPVVLTFPCGCALCCGRDGQHDCFRTWLDATVRDESRYMRTPTGGISFACPMGCKDSFIQQPDALLRSLAPEHHILFSRFSTRLALTSAVREEHKGNDNERGARNTDVGVTCPYGGCNLLFVPGHDHRLLYCAPRAQGGCGRDFCRACLRPWNRCTCSESEDTEHDSGAAAVTMVRDARGHVQEHLWPGLNYVTFTAPKLGLALREVSEDRNEGTKLFARVVDLNDDWEASTVIGEVIPGSLVASVGPISVTGMPYTRVFDLLNSSQMTARPLQIGLLTPPQQTFVRIVAATTAAAVAEDAEGYQQLLDGNDKTSTRPTKSLEAMNAFTFNLNSRVNLHLKDVGVEHDPVVAVHRWQGSFMMRRRPRSNDLVVALDGRSVAGLSAHEVTSWITRAIASSSSVAVTLVPRPPCEGPIAELELSFPNSSRADWDIGADCCECSHMPFIQHPHSRGNIETPQELPRGAGSRGAESLETDDGSPSAVLPRPGLSDSTPLQAICRLKFGGLERRVQCHFCGASCCALHCGFTAVDVASKNRPQRPICTDCLTYIVMSDSTPGHVVDAIRIRLLSVTTEARRRRQHDLAQGRMVYGTVRRRDQDLQRREGMEQSVQASELWIKRLTKKCPQCKAPIQKNGGCNHMTCVSQQCGGYHFCWLCMQPYTPGHFENSGCAQYSR